MSDAVEDLAVDLSAVDGVDPSRSVEELSIRELRREHEALNDAIEWFDHPTERQRDLLDRAADGWTELRERVPVEYPECPRDDCTSREWYQSPGDPYYCAECNHEVADARLSDEISDAEDRIAGQHDAQPDCPECGTAMHDIGSENGDSVWTCIDCVDHAFDHAEDPPGLSAPPEEILDGLTIAVTETGQRHTVSTDRLIDDGVLVVAEGPDADENMGLAPRALADRIYIEGTYYVPDHTPHWEVNEALRRLAGGRDD